MNKKTTLVNIVFSLIFQIFNAFCGFFISREILLYFGSNIFGLTNSINQFLNYIVLLEGGITGVIAANLYKPIVDNDNLCLSSVMVTARSFYKRIGLFLAIYTVLIGIIYPRVVNTGFENKYIFILTCALSFHLFLEYMFSITYISLLNADKKGYVVNIVSTFLIIGNVGLTIFVLKKYPDIIVLQFFSALLFILKPLIFCYYIKKNYKINWKAPIVNSLIKQRWDGFIINFAFFIHIGTDVTVLTLMSDLETVSVYSAYYLVISKICVVIHSIASGIEPTIGQAYAKGDNDDLCLKLDLYEFIILFFVSLLFSLTGLLVCPFVMIYTRGVTDTNYYQPLFGILLVLAEALYLVKYPHVSLAYSANKFKELTVPALIEAFINILVSILLFRYLGLVGVAIGTICAMLYRMIFHIFFTNKLLHNRKPYIFIKKLLLFSVSSLLGTIICYFFIPFYSFSIISWVLHAVVYGLILLICSVLISLIFFKKEVSSLFEYLNINFRIKG